MLRIAVLDRKMVQACVLAMPVLNIAMMHVTYTRAPIATMTDRKTTG